MVGIQGGAIGRIVGDSAHADVYVMTVSIISHDMMIMTSGDMILEMIPKLFLRLLSPTITFLPVYWVHFDWDTKGLPDTLSLCIQGINTVCSTI